MHGTNNITQSVEIVCKTCNFTDEPRVFCNRTHQTRTDIYSPIEYCNDNVVSYYIINNTQLDTIYVDYLRDKQKRRESYERCLYLDIEYCTNIGRPTPKCLPSFHCYHPPQENRHTRGCKETLDECFNRIHKKNSDECIDICKSRLITDPTKTDYLCVRETTRISWFALLLIPLALFIILFFAYLLKDINNNGDLGYKSMQTI